jgi:SAM-dependent methyltransferase
MGGIVSGPLSAIARTGDGIRRRIETLYYERRLGISTDGVIAGADLGFGDERLQPYQAADWRTLQRVLPKRDIGPGDVFVDLGSGMGRMVLRAAEYPFRRVIGVELSPELHAIAVANLRQAGADRDGRIELVCADALTWEIPDDTSVFFLYNPFRDEVFAAAMERVFASYDRHPRRIRIVYRNPVEHERLIASGRVRVTGRWRHSVLRGLPRRVGILVYEVLPAAGSGGAGGA